MRLIDKRDAAQLDPAVERLLEVLEPGPLREVAAAVGDVNRPSKYEIRLLGLSPGIDVPSGAMLQVSVIGVPDAPVLPLVAVLDQRVFGT